MNFNKILLDDYLKTPDGVKVTRFFENLEEHYRARFRNRKFFEFVKDVVTLDYNKYAFAEELEDEFAAPAGCRNFKQFVKESSVKFTDERAARDWQYAIPSYSMELYFASPEFAFPYLFYRDFHKLQIIFETFGIPLPPVPGRMKHTLRFHYYFELCRVLLDFRNEYGMSALELCVFLYGFAPRFVGELINNEYGEANRVYIVGATHGDVENGALANPTDDSVSVWQGNEETVPGDIIIVYETAPYSRIRTIWRAISRGSDDPFCYYPGSIFVGHPVVVPAVSVKQLREDSVWSKKSLVKSSMQGVNGVPCTVKEYEALKALFKKNDPKFDLKKVPTPPPYAQFFNENLKVEKDVEEQLLEPLLKRIGHNKWVRQLPLRMGRGDRVFPDYALRVKGRGDDASAEFVWEAKYRIPSAKQLRIDFGQAKSYALRLQSRALGLVAIEGVWFTTAEDGFRFEKLVHFNWEQLKSPDNLAVLKRVFS